MKDETLIKIYALTVCTIVCIAGIFIENPDLYLIAFGAILGILGIPAATTGKIYFFKKKNP